MMMPPDPDVADDIINIMEKDDETLKRCRDDSYPVVLSPNVNVGSVLDVSQGPSPFSFDTSAYHTFDLSQDSNPSPFKRRREENGFSLFGM